MECGPWRPIYLESFTSRIADVRVDSVVSEDLSTVKVDVTVECVRHSPLGREYTAS